jgi:uncharacterized membrane protein
VRKKQTIPPQHNNPAASPLRSHQQTVVHHQQTVQTIFDPEVLLKYKAMVPDAPERVLAVFEQNSATERQMIELALKAHRADNLRRDWMAFLIIIVGMITSGLFAYLDKPWLSGTTLAAIIGYAVLGFLHKGKQPSQSQQ